MSSSQAHEASVARGLKAAIHNPRVSDEAKERAQERLDDMNATSETDAPSSRSKNDAHEANVARDLKATTHNPRVSNEAKENARQRLEENSTHEDDASDDRDVPSLGLTSAHEANVARGLKAAISNPRVSDEAKERAQERLEEMDM
ncbi:hypothetical protein PQX77_009151 [Marasmius sp. AFHP31]|nr:hypothetical protein PQX77_009151 [Marasmius sp. AFHP31]